MAQPVVFGPEGVAPDLTGPGLGIQVLDQVLHDLSVWHLEFAA